MYFFPQSSTSSSTSSEMSTDLMETESNAAVVSENKLGATSSKPKKVQVEVVRGHAFTVGRLQSIEYEKITSRI